MNKAIMDKKILISIAALVLVGCLSVFWAGRTFTSPQTHRATIDSLDEKKETVMELAAASTAASAAITLIPGDTATPIADKLADLSGGFLIVLCALFLEKYLLTITGYASFYILIPLGCAAGVGYLLWRKGWLAQIGIKLAMLGLALSLIIPASVWVSDKIDRTYRQSIDSTIETAVNSANIIENNEKINKGFISGLTQSVSDAAENLEHVLNNFLEALAVMLVTSCVIPVLVLLFFVWVVKTVMGVHIPAPLPKPALSAIESKTE